MNDDKREKKVTMPKKSFAKFHFNPRLILGVILIATSFISAYVITETNNRMTIVWSAVTDLAPGEIIEASDVIKSRVLLPDNASYYLADRPRPKDSDEVHNWDTVQEKLSFSDRFGLTLTFEPANQEKYLEIVRHLASLAKLKISLED